MPSLIDFTLELTLKYPALIYSRSVEMNWQIKTYIDKVFILDG
jgi:hypothetical protein